MYEDGCYIVRTGRVHDVLKVVVVVMAAGKKGVINSFFFGFGLRSRGYVFLGENKPQLLSLACLTVVFFTPSTPHPCHSHSSN